jgi:hypothetical protein
MISCWIYGFLGAVRFDGVGGLPIGLLFLGMVEQDGAGGVFWFSGYHPSPRRQAVAMVCCAFFHAEHLFVLAFIEQSAIFFRLPDYLMICSVVSFEILAREHRDPTSCLDRKTSAKESHPTTQSPPARSFAHCARKVTVRLERESITLALATTVSIVHTTSRIGPHKVPTVQAVQYIHTHRRVPHINRHHVGYTLPLL